MKIMFVIAQMSGGGAERVTSVLANEFAKKEDEVAVVTVIDGSIDYKLSDSVVYIPNQTQYEGRIKRVRQRYKHVQKAIEVWQPDVILSFTTQINIYTILASKKSTAELIVSERNDPYNDPESRVTRRLRDWIYSGCRANYVFQTEDARHYFGRRIQESSTIIPNPLKEGLPDVYTGVRDKVIVTAGRLAPQKNYPMLLEAFAAIGRRYPEYRLRIFGDGPLKTELKQLTKQLGIEQSVTFEGFSKELHEQIRTATAFVLASNYEGISNAMLESLALGIPTICTDCPAGGAKMNIHNMENGILVPVGDSSKLEQAMAYVIEHPEEAKQMGLKGAEIRNQLKSENIVAMWGTYIKKIGVRQ